MHWPYSTPLSPYLCLLYENANFHPFWRLQVKGSITNRFCWLISKTLLGLMCLGLILPFFINLHIEQSVLYLLPHRWRLRVSVGEKIALSYSKHGYASLFLFLLFLLLLSILSYTLLTLPQTAAAVQSGPRFQST